MSYLKNKCNVPIPRNSPRVPNFIQGSAPKIITGNFAKMIVLILKAVHSLLASFAPSVLIHYVLSWKPEIEDNE